MRRITEYRRLPRIYSTRPEFRRVGSGHNAPLIRFRRYTSIQGGSKKGTTDSWPQFCQILIDLKKFFHWKIPSKSCSLMRLKIPPHLAYVATLPCETLMSAKQAVKIWQNYGHESVSPFFGPLCTLFACLYRLLSHLSFFSLFPYLLIFSFEIDSLCFQAGCRKRRPNVALVFVCVYFVL